MNLEIYGLDFGEYDFNRGRPRRTAPTVRTEATHNLISVEGKLDWLRRVADQTIEIGIVA